MICHLQVGDTVRSVVYIDGLRAKSCGIDSSLSLKTCELRMPGQEEIPISPHTLRHKERANFSFLYLFVLFRLSVDWMRLNYLGEGSLLH